MQYRGKEENIASLKKKYCTNFISILFKQKKS